MSNEPKPNSPHEDTQWDIQIKMLLIGDTGIFLYYLAVGKTCLMLKYTKNEFNPVFITTVVLYNIIIYRVLIINLK